MLGISEFMLGFNFIEAFLSFQIMLFFIYDIFFKKKKERSKFNLLSFYFLFLGISKCVMIFNDFYLTEISPYFDLIYLIGTGFAIIGVIFFVSISEEMLKLPYNLVTIAGFALFLLTYILPLLLNFPLDFVRIVYYIMFPILFLFIFISLVVLALRTIGLVRKYIIFIIVGLGIFGIGRALNTEYLELIGGESINLMGVILSVIGLAVIGFSFRALPSLSELEWHTKIHHLYILNTSNGICLLNHSFQTKEIMDQEIKIDADLLAGGLTGVMGLIKEMISEEDEDQYLKVIDHMDVKLIIQRGHFITAILVAKKELNILSKKLEQLVRIFEQRNSKYLINFDGSVSQYKKDQDIVKEIFEIK